MSLSTETALYESYEQWKGWGEPFVWSAEEARYFAAETRGIALAGARVLEIGFGNGAFLGWAQSRGADISGCEVTPASLRAAEAKGIALVPADFEDCGALAPDSMDLIAAFDVFEHLPPPLIIAKLRAIDTALKPGGTLLLRYPNGQSPFGLAPQHGDATHITALSAAKMAQYATGTALRTVDYRGVARIGAGNPLKSLVRAIRWGLRDCHKAAIHFLYATDVELEPVVIHRMVKDAPEKWT